MTRKNYSPVAIAIKKAEIACFGSRFFGGLPPDPAAVTFSPSEAGGVVAS